MGLGSFKSAWQRQTLHFGHEHADKYSVLILDNRGMGDSDVPLMRYSTSEMARDAVEVLEHVGWLPPDSILHDASSSSSSPPSSTSGDKGQEQQQQQRTLHVVGISMGGMIAQELAYLVPTRLSTLNLCCTAAAIENTTTFWENMVQRAQMLLPKSLEESVRGAARNTFPPGYLLGPDTIHLPRPSPDTRVHPPDAGSATSSASTGSAGAGARAGEGRGTKEYLHFSNNYERFVAGEMHKRLDSKRFTTKGFLLQLIAAGWHHKSPAQLKEIGDRVGRERILVLHGTADRMISVPHGYKLRAYLGGDDEGSGLMAVIRDGAGHVPPLECTEWFHELIEERIRKGEALDGR